MVQTFAYHTHPMIRVWIPRAHIKAGLSSASMRNHCSLRKWEVETGVPSKLKGQLTQLTQKGTEPVSKQDGNVRTNTPGLSSGLHTHLHLSWTHMSMYSHTLHKEKYYKDFFKKTSLENTELFSFHPLVLGV